ncbi:electron transport complex subunit RsxG [Azonexus caeni]|jgi:electron transport complex protein RnfG|uniref:electron transport complex subunit RsxG n=1 Tax=Azonexus caeni TaxID=266126 RepID=UPI003A877417
MTSTPREFTASGMALRTAAILFLFVIVFTGLLSAAYQWTKPSIEASALAEKMKLLNEVLPAADYDNNLLDDSLLLPPTPELGLKEASTLYRARKAGQPAALIFEAAAPDGYAGRIRLLIAVRADGKVAGVRVTQHKETPGLGDYIDPRKDKNKTAPWIDQFVGLSLASAGDKAWRVRKDGGRLDYHAGATVSPRAVAKAVQRAVRWVDGERDRLFSEGKQP